jgi:hypothetical protein
LIGTLGVGDVIAVDGAGWAADLIRFGAILEGESTPASHVVVATRIDRRARWWGIEGRPGGVGWVDMAKYTTGKLAPLSNSNELQPRTDAERALIAKVAEGLLGTDYDWFGGITGDGLDDIHLKDLTDIIDHLWGWKDQNNIDVAPGHVVCSSAAEWIYRALHLKAPQRHITESVQPADWWIFNHTEGWMND